MADERRRQAIDVHVTYAGGRTYYVMVDGKVYDSLVLQHGVPPLTWSQMFDIADGYREALASEV